MHHSKASYNRLMVVPPHSCVEDFSLPSLVSTVNPTFWRLLELPCQVTLYRECLSKVVVTVFKGGRGKSSIQLFVASSINWLDFPPYHFILFSLSFHHLLLLLQMDKVIPHFLSIYFIIIYIRQTYRWRWQWKDSWILVICLWHLISIHNYLFTDNTASQSLPIWRLVYVAATLT